MASLSTRFLDHTPNDAPQSVGVLWTSDQLVAETSTWQHNHTQQKNIHAPGGIRTHDRSRRAAVDLRLRPRGHWDRHCKTLPKLNKVIIKCTVHCIVHLQCTFVCMKVRDSDVLAWIRGQSKMSQVLGAFGLLYFTMLRPVLAWRGFWNLSTVYFFNL
jgi:hypothetical protein